MSQRDVLCEAIRNRQVISCTYEGHHRQVQPLVLLQKEDSSEVLHCWQIGGTTSSGRRIPCWGNFDVLQMSEVTVMEQSFIAPNGYNPDRFERIVCQVPKTQ